MVLLRVRTGGPLGFTMSPTLGGREDGCTNITYFAFSGREECTTVGLMLRETPCYMLLFEPA